jgi:hypothetical protein
MALLHQAELRPSKMELLDGWAPSQLWFRGELGTTCRSVGAFRWDDPEGEVGVETHLVSAGDSPVMQIPVTYRGAPLAGAEQHLIGTMEHSVLGPRWVYDGAGDPVYLLTVASAALHGAPQASLEIEIDGKLVAREPNAAVSGTVVDGAPEVSLATVDFLTVASDESQTVVDAAGLRITVIRTPSSSVAPPAGAGTVSGTWEGQPGPLLLVTVEA